ncbi:urease accessory protein UreE [Prochlorococcus sp. MIT 1341]|uniref:urease accessory protein UreE n=1 Tax=Prochlorococcus sp. MIT 1341 TaxID=3096221 RepID=UPI002A75D833|nr:urease accessory protein UreE [Prochlorococcus sp. MIT 1341]
MANQPILLTQRIEKVKDEKLLFLPLSAEQRTKLRGLRKTTCGINVLLQLPREGPLRPGEILTSDKKFPLIEVKAAIEELIQVESSSSLELAKASYHLGNRHVDLEIQDQQLFFLKDPVLELMLKKRGLILKNVSRPFQPESGAYSDPHK